MTESKHTMPGEGIPQFLYDVVRLLEARVSTHLRGTGLHWGLRRILQQLWIEDGLSQAELAGAARVSQASISNMLKHLIDGEWVERRQDAYDYRISRVYLARRGRELRDAVERELAIAEADLREQMGVEGADRLAELLRRALEVLDAAPDLVGNASPRGIWDHSSPPGEL